MKKPRHLEDLNKINLKVNAIYVRIFASNTLKILSFILYCEWYNTVLQKIKDCAIISKS